jgi:hypothetical protein
METTNTKTATTNFEIGFRMQKEGYGISDSFGSALATGEDGIPTDADIEEWVRGYNAAKELTNSEILTVPTLILGRKNLVDSLIDKEFSFIEPTDLKISMHLFQTHNIVLFIDKDGQTKLLKNRFGNI